MHHTTDYKQIEKNSNVIIDQGYIIYEQYCTNVSCSCESVTLIFGVMKKGIVVPDFGCDILFNGLKPVNFVDYTGNCAHPEAVINALIKNPDYIKRFKEHYHKAKFYGLNHKFEDSKTVAERIKNNQLIAYNALFVPEKTIQIEYKDKTYFLYDHYCPNPDCACNTVLFDFIFVSDNRMKRMLKVRWHFLEDRWDIEDKACSKEQASGMIEKLKTSGALSEFKKRYRAVKVYSPSRPHSPKLPLQMLLAQLSKDTILKAALATMNKKLNGTKQELIIIFDHLYFDVFDRLLSRFTTPMLDYLFEMVDAGGISADIEDENTKAGLIRYLMIAFVTEEKHLTLSKEVFEILEGKNRESLYKQAVKNDLITRYAKNLSAVYGQYPLSLLTDYLRKYENLDIDQTDFYLTLDYDTIFTDAYYLEDNEIRHSYTYTNPNFQTRLKENSGLNYAQLSREEILNAEKPEAEEQLFDYLRSLEFDEADADNLIDDIYYEIKTGNTREETYQVLKGWNLNTNEHKEIKKRIDMLFETTRRFTLKGHKQEIIKPKAFDKSKYTRI